MFRNPARQTTNRYARLLRQACHTAVAVRPGVCVCACDVHGRDVRTCGADVSDDLLRSTAARVADTAGCDPPLRVYGLGKA